jgi:dUTP pyrophosphatase
MKVKVINNSGFDLPEYKTPGSAGFDLLSKKGNGLIIIHSGERKLIPTGLSVELPNFEDKAIGIELQVRPRSGLALKSGITVLNSPGTIDSDYRGEIGVLLYNAHPTSSFHVYEGDRIAQGVVAQYVKIIWDEQKELNETERGNGGFGHTGTK